MPQNPKRSTSGWRKPMRPALLEKQLAHNVAGSIFTCEHEISSVDGVAG
jgi:hypothetical protein